MNPYEVIQSKIDRLITIRLTKGVQPEDLADNIYLNDYKKICFYKEENFIIGELTFEEKLNDEVVDTTLRYVYSEDKFILRIEEQIGNDVRIEWDRNTIECTLIDDIIDILKTKFSDECSRKFINLLPDDLKAKVESACFRVA